MHVLVIDDDQDFCHLLSAHLHRKGHEVTVTHDGIQGQRVARIDHPDLIIMDYQMPGGNGLTVLDRLYSNAQTSSIPVVLLSGSVTDQITRAAAALGAHRVLSKLTLTEETLVEATETASDAVDAALEHPSLFPGESS